MKKNMKIITSAILAVGLLFIPISAFTTPTDENVVINKWDKLDTSISPTTWELGKEIVVETENTEAKKEESNTIYKEVVINQSDSFKSYMPYESVTDPTSKQYKVKGLAHTGKFGLRKIGDRYCVAVGTAITSVAGTYIDVILQNGTVIPCIVGDIKADIDTHSDNITTSDNGCVCEFIVDKDKLPYKVKNNDGTSTGNISDCYKKWNSPVEKIIVYEENVLDE